MAARVSDNPTVAEHHAAQAALLDELVASIVALEAATGGDIEKPELERVVAALVNQFSLASIAFASDFYKDLRSQQVPGQFRAPLVKPIPVEDAQAYLDAVLDQAVEGSSIMDEISKGAEKLVADAARRQLLTAQEVDEAATSWARVAKPGACAFCRMNAARGPVYKSAETAGRIAASAIWADAVGDANRFHPNCRCTVEPLFTEHWEGSAQVRSDVALWQEVTGFERGKGKLNAFRRAVEAQRQDPGWTPDISFPAR